LVKLLLTSAGIRNPSIQNALIELLGRPIAEGNALCIPTAAYGQPMSSPGGIWRFISGHSAQPMCGLGWKSLGVLELTALPSIDKARWVTWVQETDALLVNGGEATFLAYWMRQSGLAELLPSLRAVYVGFSAGSMALAPRIGEFFVDWPSSPGDETLGLVDFAIFPHLDHPDLTHNTMANAESWAAKIGCPSYAIDNETAIRVVDDTVEVVSEGQWRQFTA
jgi:dipeptidase E